MRIQLTISLLAAAFVAQGCGSRVDRTYDLYDCGDGTGIDPLFVCDGFEDCFNGEDEAYCFDNWLCYSEEEFVSPLVLCDGRADCADASDEGYCNEDYYGVYLCDDGLYEVEVEFVCDGIADCPDGSDEFYCEYSYTCDNGRNAIYPEYVCDGVVDCPDASDEIYCF